MLNRYTFIDEELAENLIHQSYNSNLIKNGDGINKFYSLKNYIVIHKQNIPLADHSTLPTTEYYYEVMVEIMKLYEKGVFIEPILGYSINEQTIKTIENSTDVQAKGYVILAKQTGEPLYKYDKIPNPFSNEKILETKKTEYLLNTLTNISNIPQAHYDKFAEDLLKIMNANLNFDAYNQENIIYNKNKGFIFTNINHKLSNFKAKEEFDKCFIRNCFALCCINFDFTKSISDTDKNTLKQLNSIIYGKCVKSLIRLNIDDDLIQKHSLNIWKI